MRGGLRVLQNNKALKRIGDKRKRRHGLRVLQNNKALKQLEAVRPCLF